MRIDFTNFPLELQEIIHGYKVLKVIEGRIGDSIIKLSKQENKFLYLKICKTSITQSAIQNEYKILNWLHDKDLNVPRVLFYISDKQISYLLISNVEGTNAHEVTNQINKKEIVRTCAKALRKIHKVEVSDIPLQYRDNLESELSTISENVRNYRIDVDAFKGANNSKTPEEIFQYLLDKKSMFEATVFTHGDYCLPNILLVDENNYGFVDWAQAGIGDIYRDLSTMFKSIKRNFGELYSALFLEYYGLTEFNNEKIHYYDMVDQFTYFKKHEKY
jgi:kanamycin kinase/aminoglycoside 3'-phosphotransferase-2